MLLIAAISLVVAGAFRDVVQPGAPKLIGLSVAIAAVLLVVYVCNLVFSLVTHRQLFQGLGEVPAAGNEMRSAVPAAAKYAAGPPKRNQTRGASGSSVLTSPGKSSNECIGLDSPR